MKLVWPLVWRSTYDRLLKELEKAQKNDARDKKSGKYKKNIKP